MFSPSVVGLREKKETATLVRKIVSQRKRRFQWGGFDLDLTYITDRIIGLSFVVLFLITNKKQTPTQRWGFRVRNSNVCFETNSPTSFVFLTPFIETITRFPDLHPDNTRSQNSRTNKHTQNKVYNLCSERKYDRSKFHDRVAEFPFEDHRTPPLELAFRFCLDVDRFLESDPVNLIAVHW